MSDGPTREELDLAELAGLETVVERLARRGPSGQSGVHCWFCGAGKAWFQCECVKAREAQDGKRAKPRWDLKRNCIVLDEETIRENEGRGYKRYVPPVVDSVDTEGRSDVSTRALNQPPPVHAKGEIVHAADNVDTEAVHGEPNVDTVDAASVHAEPDAKVGRRAYKAAHERQRRAKRKK